MLREMTLSPDTLAFQEELSRQLDEEARALLASELDSLHQITRLCESIAAKLTLLFGHKFPKSCTTCGKMYETREDYLRETQNLRGKGTLASSHGVQEYRNCTCGSTLMVWTKDRRDNSEFGEARRALFDDCLAKLKAVSTDDEAVLRERLRQIFRLACDRFSRKL